MICLKSHQFCSLGESKGLLGPVGQFLLEVDSETEVSMGGVQFSLVAKSCPTLCDPITRGGSSGGQRERLSCGAAPTDTQQSLELSELSHLDLVWLLYP